ncbi:MAG TPA: ATP-binding protein, partial [Polyangiaceae bacterium]
QKHGGTVRVSSEVGRGTTFVVSVPLGRGHLPPDRVDESKPPALVGEQLTSALLEAKQWLRASLSPEPSSSPSDRHPDAEARGRLIVADDNADMRAYLERLLSPHWEVDAFPDGRAALTAALAAPPDLVLSDFMMPEMDGVALLHALRADPRTSTVPFILISARAGEEARLEGLETGVDDYVVKPFAAREVLSRIRTHLEMAKVRRAAVESARSLAETRAQLLGRLEQEHAALQSAHEQLKFTQAQLIQSAKMASLGELVAGVAHEINNPLSFSLGHLSTIERSLGSVAEVLGDEIRRTAAAPWERALARLSEMQLGLQRIRTLVEKLRTFSRLDEGERKRVSVRESIESVLVILRHRFEERISVVTHFGEPDSLDCNASLFNQAVMNLVTNAIDAIQGQGSITLTAGAREGSFEVSVADTGSGIPERVRERVFEPFFTTKPVGQGTGLGLSIAFSIAKQHGGTIELLPRDGGGTVAVLRLPLGH